MLAVLLSVVCLRCCILAVLLAVVYTLHFSILSFFSFQFYSLLFSITDKEKGENITSKLFEAAREEIFNLMKKDSFRRFKAGKFGKIFLEVYEPPEEIVQIIDDKRASMRPPMSIDEKSSSNTSLLTVSLPSYIPPVIE